MRDGFGVLPSWDSPRSKDIVIRQSTVESMSLCPARVGYSTHPEFDPTPSEPMVFGSLVHKMIELSILHPNTLQVETLAGIEGILAEVVADDGYDIYQLTNPDHIHHIVLQAREAFLAWRSDWWVPCGMHRTMMAVEPLRIRPLGMLTKSIAVWIQGSPDFVWTGGIDDWKTAGRGWDFGKAQARIQSEFYVWLEEDNFPELDERGVPFTYVVYDRSKQRWQPHEYTVTRESVDAALLTAWEWARQIRHQVFPPTPAAPAGRAGRGWWCSANYCSAWNICEYKHQVQDKQLVQIRSSSWAA